MTKTTRTEDQGYASEGGVRQEGSLPTYRCNACGAEVVWATSRKTGRKYLVNVKHGYHGQRIYVKADFHPRDCAEQKAQKLAEFVAWEQATR